MRQKKIRVTALFFLVFSAALWNGRALSAEGSWESEWERTVKAAEQEGQVVIYKISGDSEWNAFQKKYPKIKVLLVPGSAAQIQQRILAERRAGKYLADMVRLGGGTTTVLFKSKALDPITSTFILPEVKDTSKWLDGKHHYNDVEKPDVFAHGAGALAPL